jgi:hypothetical protein
LDDRPAVDVGAWLALARVLSARRAWLSDDVAWVAGELRSRLDLGRLLLVEKPLDIIGRDARSALFRGLWRCGSLVLTND